jgi:hypothetical protein
VIIIAISEQTLRRSVPSGRDILRKRRLRINSPARPEVCKFNEIILNEDVLSKSNSNTERLTV